MVHKPSNFMENFSARHGQSATLHYGHNSPFITIEHPTALAAFFAFCNGQSTYARVYLRGSTDCYDTAYPSLFRGLPQNQHVREQTKRWRAYKHVLQRFQELKGRRWRRKDLGPVLQHYGIKTPWLDVVRNLYSAIWFATHELKNSGLDGLARPATNDYGWISFYRRKVPATDRPLLVNDISARHSSLHLRPHVQHGASLGMQSDDDESPDPFQDFNRFRIAQIRIPNSKKWKLSGYTASTAFMFPPPALDDSFRRLSVPAVQDILNDASTTFDVPSYYLGRISSYR